MAEKDKTVNEKDIIQSIMRTVVTRLFDSHLRTLPSGKDIDLNHEISKSTENLCLIASAKMLALLTEKNPNLFNKKMILKCIGVESNRFKANNEWRWHAVAVVQSISGRWYAFSPANLGNYGESYSGIVTSDTLEGLISNLEKQEGGVWTLNADEINKINFDEGIPSFYTTKLNALIDIDESSLIAAVNAYNEALDQERLPIDKGMIRKIIDRIKKY